MLDRVTPFTALLSIVAVMAIVLAATALARTNGQVALTAGGADGGSSGQAGDDVAAAGAVRSRSS